MTKSTFLPTLWQTRESSLPILMQDWQCSELEKVSILIRLGAALPVFTRGWERFVGVL